MSKSFLLQLIILCIILNCNDCSFVSLKHWYGLLRISGHSSSGIRPGDIDCHFCKSAGFTYLFLINWLYDIFVAKVTRGVGLSQLLTKGTLTLVVTAFFCTNSEEDFAWFVKHWESYSSCHRFSLFHCGPKTPHRRVWYYILAWYLFLAKVAKEKGCSGSGYICYPKLFDGPLLHMK